jgi:hypothetical protein
VGQVRGRDRRAGRRRDAERGRVGGKRCFGASRPGPATAIASIEKSNPRGRLTIGVERTGGAAGKYSA